MTEVEKRAAAAKRMREWRQKNPDKARAINARRLPAIVAWQRANRDRRLANLKRYRTRHHERLREVEKLRRAANPDKARAQARTRQARYVAAHPEKIRARRGSERARQLRQQWRVANRDKLRVYDQRRREANREKERARLARYRAEHPERVRASSTKWRLANKAKQAEATRNWQAKNKERTKKTQAAWRAANPEKVRAKQRRHDAKNPNRQKSRGNWQARYRRYKERHIERIREFRRSYQARRRLDAMQRVIDAARRRIRHVMNGRSRGAMQLLNYTAEQLRDHIQTRFTEGMSWDNYGHAKGQWHVDHERPVSSFDFTQPGAFEECWALSNLQPMWGPDNFAKGTWWNGSRWRKGKPKK